MEKVVISVKWGLWGLTLYIVNLFKLSLLPCNETEYTCKKYELLSEIWLRIVITKICVYFLLILKIFILKTLYIHAYTNAYIHIKTTGPSLCLTCNQLYLYFCNNGRFYVQIKHSFTSSIPILHICIFIHVLLLYQQYNFPTVGIFRTNVNTQGTSRILKFSVWEVFL